MRHPDGRSLTNDLSGYPTRANPLQEAKTSAGLKTSAQVIEIIGKAGGGDEIRTHGTG
jgi:hypothetical protein